MVALPRFDDNPCRPRHFKPPPCAPLIPDGPAQQALETARTRLVVAAALFALLFAVVALRGIDIVTFKNDSALRFAHLRAPSAPMPNRAAIVDRNGRLLAVSLHTPSLYADPKEIADPAGVADRLVAVLPGLDRAAIEARLASDKSFIWIKRRLTPQQEYKVNALGVPGLHFLEEERRFYPYGSLFSHVLGFTSIDNKGQAGIERDLNYRLTSEHKPLRLSLDLRVQYILRQELQRTIAAFTAKGGGGIVVNVNTGEVLALVSLPDFDPNNLSAPAPQDPEAPLKERMFDKMTLGDYELGSVMKIFNTAMALDSGVAKMTSEYDAIHPIHIGRFTITDYHGKRRMLSVPELFMYSSNIASARMAVDAGAAVQKEYLRRFGLLSPPMIDLKGLEQPQFPSDWRKVNVMTIAFGHGLSVAPVQAADAAAAVVNGGILRPLSLVKLAPGEVPKGKRVISEKTSQEMRDLMRLVVQYGTGRHAEAPGYVVGGKTGTAERVVDGRYALKKLLSSFIAAFPMNHPKYVVMTMIDGPHGNKKSYGYATAGWTAAPCARRIIERIAPILGVTPVNEASPQIAEALMPPSLRGKKIVPY